MTLDVLIIGGSPDYPGGVEAFCDRATEALERNGGFCLRLSAAGTAFLSIRKVPGYIARLAGIWRLRHRRPDVIWLQYVNLPDLGFLLVARFAGIRTVVTPHLGVAWRSQTNGVFRATSRLLLALADRLALLSSTQEREIALPSRVPQIRIRTLLPGALWDASLPEPVPSGPLRLVHSGRLSAGKGSFHFVDLCAALARRGVPFSAVVTGSADAGTMAQLQAAIASHGLEARITMLGRVDEAEQIAVLRRSDVLVHLSTIDSYPLIVLESLACGVFPICIDLAGAHDIVETYCGQLVPACRATEKALDFLADCDPQVLRVASYAAGTRVREDYRWDCCATLLGEALAVSAR